MEEVYQRLAKHDAYMTGIDDKMRCCAYDGLEDSSPYTNDVLSYYWNQGFHGKSFNSNDM